MEGKEEKKFYKIPPLYIFYTFKSTAYTYPHRLPNDTII